MILEIEHVKKRATKKIQTREHNSEDGQGKELPTIKKIMHNDSNQMDIQLYPTDMFKPTISYINLAVSLIFTDWEYQWINIRKGQVWKWDLKSWKS